MKYRLSFQLFHVLRVLGTGMSITNGNLPQVRQIRPFAIKLIAGERSDVER